jgi:hypothetical protein
MDRFQVARYHLGRLSADGMQIHPVAHVTTEVATLLAGP